MGDRQTSNTRNGGVPITFPNTTVQGREECPWKRIVFTQDLVKKILEGKVRCTYRKTPKLGKFLVLDSRFKPSKNASCTIHCYRSDEVDPRNITDKDARLAGIQTSAKLKELFTTWYGSVPPIVYRNWFRVLEVESEVK